MIDLRSDTVTTPTDAMRQAARDATVGDDVYGEDPTVNAFDDAVADLLGTEAALFCVSGTMANQIAVRCHTEPGEEVLCERNSHVYRWELAGIAQHSGCQPRTLDGDERGILTPEQIAEGIVAADGHQAGTGLLTLENTHNAAGGTALAPATTNAAADTAQERSVPVHLDGARLWNAAVAHDVSPARFTASVDSVMCSLSKGLGAPVGSVLAGTAELIENARRVRKLFGGGWRQAGILAAPARQTLDDRDRLAADHRRAATLADGLAEVQGLSVRPPETNIVLVRTDRPAAAVLEACADAGVQGVPFDDDVIRFCTHRDVDDGDVSAALEAVDAALS